MLARWTSQQIQALEVSLNIEEMSGQSLVLFNGIAFSRLTLRMIATTSESSHVVVSPLPASIWKITIIPGTIIHSKDDVLLILEAMKTEIPVEAGKENVGKKVKQLGRNVREGAIINAGDILVVFE